MFIFQICFFKYFQKHFFKKNINIFFQNNFKTFFKTILKKYFKNIFLSPFLPISLHLSLSLPISLFFSRPKVPPWKSTPSRFLDMCTRAAGLPKCKAKRDGTCWRRTWSRVMSYSVLRDC